MIHLKYLNVLDYKHSDKIILKQCLVVIIVF